MCEFSLQIENVLSFTIEGRECISEFKLATHLNLEPYTF